MAARSLAVTALLLAGCSHPAPGGAPPAASSSSVAPVIIPPKDQEARQCRARIAELSPRAKLTGTPDFDAVRADVLGRARGEPVVFVRSPATAKPSSEPALARALLAFEKGRPGSRVDRLVRDLRAQLPSLRGALLREGYLFSTEPEDALAMSQLHLRDLFDEPAVFIERGTRTRKALRKERREGRAYVWADGDDAGRDADLLFGDRLSDNADIGPPLHRDFRRAAAEIGFDRAILEELYGDAIVARLRFGDRWVRSVLSSEGAELRLECRDADDSELAAVDSFVAADAPRRRSLARLSREVSFAVTEAFRFDRPEGEKTAERDGELRPYWYAAYLRGSGAFAVDGVSYPTRDPSGRPWPPEVCMDFVLDSYERASGTWFRGAGEPPGRVRGALDFDAHKIENRRGVIGFLKFAEHTPALFDVRHFRGEERIPFGDRKAFFRYLVDHADELRAGDVLAIQGTKRDGLIHQHAILLEDTDPLTGFAYGLADQMKRPRRRTWEGIMAEAPLRSLLYRARPTDEVLLASERNAAPSP